MNARGVVAWRRRVSIVRRLVAVLAARPLSRHQIFYEEMMAALGARRYARAFRELAEAVPYDRLTAEPENAAPALLAAAGFINWNGAGLRPTHLPEARLRAAAEIFTQTGIAHLIEAPSFDMPTCHMMLRELTRTRLLGRGRAASILSNVIVPFALARGVCSGKRSPRGVV